MKIIRTDIDNIDSLSEWERDQIYNGYDVTITHDVFNAISQQLDNQTAATYNFSRELQGPVLEMGARGILIDQIRRGEVIEEMFERMEILEKQLEKIVYDGVGMDSFNWRSNNDLQRLFYDELGIPAIKKGGRPTTDRNAREKLEAYPIAIQLVKHINALVELGDKISVLKTEIDRDGRIRTSYNIAGTSTGRFSSSLSEFGTGGNLQNVEESLRSIFIADRGYKFAKCDAKSGESFCVGAIEWNLFKDGAYLDACESGDPHTAVARLIWPGLGWTGNINEDKTIAEQDFYRHYSYRFMCKKLGHGCLTSDHEVLTPNGWVPIENKPQIIMAWSEAGSEFQSVDKWTDFEYTGQLQSFESKTISLLCTHDHRIPYKSEPWRRLLETTADKGPRRGMPLGSGWIGGKEEVPARIIAAFMCDGYIDKYNIRFHFHKERKVQRLIELLEIEGIEYKFRIETDGSYRIWIKKFNWPKRPGAFMFNWSRECLEDFITELNWWDGCIANYSSIIYCKYKEDLEWYQTFGRIIGIGGQIKETVGGFGTLCYVLRQNNQISANEITTKWEQINVENKRVLCPSVSTSWFYVRRNGKIFITGNSNYGGKPSTLAQQAKVDFRLVQQFQPKYFKAFPAHEQWQNSVDEHLRRYGYLITLTGRKRWFFGRRNDPSTLREAIAYDPQGSLADIVNIAMRNIWRQRTAIIMMHEHDALTFMYPEETEDEIIPQLMKQLIVPIELKYGRQLRIPYDCQVGWNKGKYHPEKNPNGLKDYRGHDERKRQEEANLMDTIVRRANRKYI